MNSDLTESVQASIRPGEMVDTYYFGETNLQKQAYPAVCNTRFVQNFTNLGAGSSQFVISPNGGVSDIILQLQMPTIATTTGLALSQGWGYSLINRLSVRYGSSAQYFWTGTQMYLQNLIDCENTTKASDLSKLGGNFAAGAATSGALAYVYLKLPHNSVRASGKPLPFPSDLLVQPIVITVELLAASAVFFVQTGGSITTAPAALAAAQMQVKQEMLTDSSDLLARRVDMNSHAYTFPLQYFCQQEVTIPVTSDAQNSQQSVNLTGFRAGEVQSIVLWLSYAGNPALPGSGSYNQNVWPLISGVTLTYNGEIFSRFDAGSNPLWGLSIDEKSQSITTVNATAGAAGSNDSGTVQYWVVCPFAQVCVPYDREMKLCHGKPILNAVVNLTFTCPAASTSFVLHAMYLYNSSLLCSRGSAEYIF